MRVAMKRNEDPTPCESLPFGEVEDYTVNIALNANGGNGENSLVLNLNGTPDVGHIDLYAVMKSNVANGFWELEKSNDNMHFEVIQSGETQEDNSQLLREKDNDPSDGQNFYRISLYNENGNLLLRNYTAIPFEHVPTFGLFPNPASSTFSIQFSDMIGKNVRIEIYNQLGQPVYREIIQEVVDPIYQIPISDWKDGMYQVMIFPEGRRMLSRQLVVNKMR